MLKPLGIVVNPTSGKGKGQALGKQAMAELERAGVEFLDLSATDFATAAANARRAVESQEIRGLLVVGGDGMAHLGVNACAQSNVPLGIIAAGTGNDSARTLGLPTDDVVAGVRAVLASLDNPRPVDLLRGKTNASEFWSLGTVSAGFDALVNRRANQMRWPKGPRRYEVAMVLELAKFKGISYQATIDGKPRQIEAMLCAVANSPAFGGGMMIVPEARVDDGQMELFIVHKISRGTLLKIFPKVYTGGHVGHPAVEIVKAQTVILDSGSMPAYSDGESVGQSPIAVSIAPKALLVFAPVP
ncbi:MAG: diacylglycerol/lipid kinase family protein [Micrococcales bacterium]